MAFGGANANRHVDLARIMTGGFKMKPIHMAEVLAVMDLPGKLTAPPFAITRMIHSGQWTQVKEACEVDVISTALLLARWKRLHDPRLTNYAVEGRVLRRVAELVPDRTYIVALQARRDEQFRAQIAHAANDAATLAPWLDQEAA